VSGCKRVYSPILRPQLRFREMQFQRRCSRLRLPREPCTVQKFLFGWRRIAAHRTVSMRKSREFHNDIAMDRCIFQSLRIVKCLVEPHGAILIGT
jgi:hypothetical protein